VFDCSLLPPIFYPLGTRAQSYTTIYLLSTSIFKGEEPAGRKKVQRNEGEEKMGRMIYKQENKSLNKESGL